MKGPLPVRCRVHGFELVISGERVERNSPCNHHSRHNPSVISGERVERDQDAVMHRVEKPVISGERVERSILSFSPLPSLDARDLRRES